MTDNQLKELSNKIAYITINPKGSALKSAQKGFKLLGLEPKHLIYVKPTDRINKELRRYKFSFFTKFLLPKLKEITKKNKLIDEGSANIPIPNIIKVSKLNCNSTLEQIKKYEVKYLINCGAGIFRKKIINIQGLIILNAHAGKLPNYKNMNVVEWALLNKEKVIGTIHRIDLGIDTGPVWLEKEIIVPKFNQINEVRNYAFDCVLKMFGQAVIMNELKEVKVKKFNVNQGKKYYKMHSFYLNKLLKYLNN